MTDNIIGSLDYSPKIPSDISSDIRAIQSREELEQLKEQFRASDLKREKANDLFRERIEHETEILLKEIEKNRSNSGLSEPHFVASGEIQHVKQEEKVAQKPITDDELFKQIEKKNESTNKFRDAYFLSSSEIDALQPKKDYTTLIFGIGSFIVIVLIILFITKSKKSYIDI